MRLPKIRFDRNQRKKLGKALFNTANLVLAIFVLGQYISKESFNLATIILGIILWIVLFIVSTFLNKEK
ncbi:MAG: hypothetical protein HY738_18455 [Bacteroidia bacterium]|nr:hypothetical protein [Bacteroidia bacterium]